MKNLSLQILVFSCLLGISGCSTNDLPTTSTYSFANPFVKPITMDTYGSIKDYSHSSNRIARYLIDPGAKISISFPVLESYWIDWYSADYSLNNWANPRLNANDEFPSPLPGLKIALENDIYTFHSLHADTSRSIILAGNDTASHWKMGITDDTTLHGYYELVFNKGFEGTLTMKPLAGAPSIQDFTFQTIRFDSKNHFDLDLISKKDNTHCGLIIWDAAAGNRDTLILVRHSPGIPSGIGYYPMLRQ